MSKKSEKLSKKLADMAAINAILRGEAIAARADAEARANVAAQVKAAAPPPPPPPTPTKLEVFKKIRNPLERVVFAAENELDLLNDLSPKEVA